ncbi:hypothetical protein [Eubacterium limosum]|uniref:hypothetical protein n=1 Tax=Eubacterium limosum TaxID=1736 RepID=UPI003719BA11
MRHKYNNVRVDLLKMCTKYIPKGFYADGKFYEIKEIVEVKKGFIRCGSPGLRYLVITDKKNAELLYDNRIKQWTAIIYDPPSEEKKSHEEILNDLKYLN